MQEAKPLVEPLIRQILIQVDGVAEVEEDNYL